MGKLKELVLELALKKNIEVTSFRDRRIWEIEKKYESGQINLAQAIEELKKEFGYHIDKWDWVDFEKRMRQ